MQRAQALLSHEGDMQMLIAIGMVLLGAVLVIGPWVGVFGEINQISAMILTIIGAVVLLVSGLLIIIARLYQKTSANEAFVRTGMGGRSVVLDGGALVIPVVH